MKKTKGFTLIELLVVISIIGLLSTIVLSSLQQARAKSRNSSRRQTLVSLRTALELYSVANNAYPITGAVWYSSSTGEGGGIQNGPGNNGAWIPGLTPSFISTLPNDPQGGNTTNPTAQCVGYKRSYMYRSSTGVGYKLISNCAPEGTWTATNTFYDPQRINSAWMVCRAPDCNL
jgi:prepilin-type N-terminal cleavage/methylation domain-containing protein